MRGWGYLALAIVAELVATASLKASRGFTRPGFVALVVLGYGSAFYLMSLTLRTIPLGVTYAVWSGAGTAAIALIGAVAFREPLDARRVAGIALIVAGVAVLNLSRPAEPPP